MSVAKPSRYVIFGAGAVGGAVAGLLARSGVRVICVARPTYAEALMRGIIIREDSEDLTVSAECVTSARDLSPEIEDLAIITTKSQATGTAVRELYEVYGANLRVVCLQNGARNEEIAARAFERVYAGLVFISAVQLEPSVITLPLGRKLAIGCYPTGLDDAAIQVCADLRGAGFDAIASAYVMSMKWGKLVANLNNATTTITGYWLERASADPDMQALMLAVREEGLRVLDAAGIAVEPPEGEPSPIRIRVMTEKLRQSLQKAEVQARSPVGTRTYSSMWQDLFLGRKDNEAAFLNGEIKSLGEKLGIPTPYNSMLLEIVNRMFEEGEKPGIYTPAQLADVIQRCAG